MALIGLAASACGGSSGPSAASTTTTSRPRTPTTAGPSVTPTSAGSPSTTVSPAPAGTGSTTSTTKAGATTTTAAHTPGTVNIGSAQNGQTVVLHVGDTLVISLDGCGGCGYSWQMTGKPNPVVLTYEGEQTTTASTTSTTAGQPPMVGLPVTYTWTFKAVGAHTTGFIAQYYPPGRNTPAQTYAVQLTVRP